MKRDSISRRDFLNRSAAAVATLTALKAAAGESDRFRPDGQSSAPPVPANSKITLGMMGTGGRGKWLITEDLSRRPYLEIACVCDCDENRANQAADEVESRMGRRPKVVTDFRRMLDDSSIDAIFSCTPDHWHALGTILACQAGKDVYVEKPASHSPWEGRKMVEAARKYRRIVQLGTQNRSAAYAHQAVEFLRSGGIGEIHLVRVFNMKEVPPVSVQPDCEPPKGIDFNLWAGPAPLKFNPNSLHHWHWFWVYSGGDIINDGIHQIDAARMLVGKEYPRSVSCSGGNLGVKDAKEAPDTQLATWDFDDLIMTFELTLWTPHIRKLLWRLRNQDVFPRWQFNSTTIEIQGTKGMMYFARHGGGWEAWDLQGQICGSANGRHPHPAHIDNFFKCMQTRETPNADIEQGHRSTLLAQMANISYRVGGRKLRFDPKTESFPGDAEANRYLKREYRPPWIVPENV